MVARYSIFNYFYCLTLTKKCFPRLYTIQRFEFLCLFKYSFINISYNADLYLKKFNWLLLITFAGPGYKRNPWATGKQVSPLCTNPRFESALFVFPIQAFHDLVTCLSIKLTFFEKCFWLIMYAFLYAELSATPL